MAGLSAKGNDADMVEIGFDGKPVDKSYLECGLPECIIELLEPMQRSWARRDAGKLDMNWDCIFCDLQTEINCAEVGGRIDSEQAWYLRSKYLRLEKPEGIA